MVGACDLEAEAEAKAGTETETGRSRRDFTVFETERDHLMLIQRPMSGASHTRPTVQLWTPAAADRVKYAHLPTPVH
jgi:hypothetical protein